VGMKAFYHGKLFPSIEVKGQPRNKAGDTKFPYHPWKSPQSGYNYL
jgi:hypothetical protein